MGRRKPCPFCGGTNIVDGDMIDGGPVAICRECYGSGPEGNNRRDATRLWNKRAEAKAREVSDAE